MQSFKAEDAGEKHCLLRSERHSGYARNGNHPSPSTKCCGEVANLHRRKQMGKRNVVINKLLG